MAEHPDVTRLVAAFREQGVPSYERVGVLKARAILENVTRIQAPAVPLAEVRDILVPGAEGLLPARVYDPQLGGRPPLLVYLHGGGWALGSVRVADRPCRRLAAASGCVIVSLEYRRAPETKFPGPLLDCLAAIRWLAGAADELGADPQRLVLLGDSAGGNLAAAAALCCREEGPDIACQMLLYPCLAPTRSATFASLAEHAGGPLMTRRELEWFWGLYLRDERDERDPRAAPLAAEELEGVAPASIVLAELDPLHDEGLAYARRLEDAGVPVSVTVYPGAAHGFWWMDGEMSQAGELTAQLARLLAAGVSAA